MLATGLSATQRRNDRWSLVLLCVVLLGAASCQSLVYDGTRTQPSDEELVGVWVPDQESLNYLQENGYDRNTQTQIRIERDHTYALINMPDLWWYGGNSRGTFRTSRGTFEVSRDADRPYWFLVLREHGNHQTLALLGQRPPFKLRFSFGNIDSNPQSLTFVKER
jgi:hypothetical protein